MSVLFSDDFSTDKSAQYTIDNIGGVPATRVSNQLVATGGTEWIWTAGSGLADVYAQFKVVTVPVSGAGYWAIDIRRVDSGNSYYVGGDNAGSSIAKFDAGVSTSLTAFPAISANDVVRVQIGGRAIIVWVNGVQAAVLFGDATHAAGQVAFYIEGCTIDDFEVGTMDGPYLVGVGTSTTGTGNVSPTAAAGYATNDVFDLLIESCGGEAANLGTANGFAAAADSPSNTGATTSGTRITNYWKRAASGSESFPTVTDPGDHVYAQILTWRGCITSGNPWDVTAAAQKASASTSASAPGDTTTVANTAIRVAIARDNDSAAAAFSAWANSDLTRLTEVSDAGTTSGNGGGFGVLIGEKTAAGAFGTTTATVTSSINASHTIALKPPSTGQTVSVGLITETDTVFGFTHLKTKAVGLATETDTALAATKKKAKAIGLTIEAGSALAMVFTKAKAIGLALETDEAFSVVHSGQTVAIGLVEETDSALAVIHLKAKAIGLITEIDSALSFTWRKAKAIGLATETNTSLAMSFAKGWAIGLAEEVSSAFSMGKQKSKALGLALEFDSALAVEGGAEGGDAGSIFGNLASLFGVQANLFAAQNGLFNEQLF